MALLRKCWRCGGGAKVCGSGVVVSSARMRGGAAAAMLHHATRSPCLPCAVCDGVSTDFDSQRRLRHRAGDL